MTVQERIRMSTLINEIKENEVSAKRLGLIISMGLAVGAEVITKSKTKGARDCGSFGTDKKAL